MFVRNDIFSFQIEYFTETCNQFDFLLSRKPFVKVGKNVCCRMESGSGRNVVKWKTNIFHELCKQVELNARQLTDFEFT